MTVAHTIVFCRPKSLLLLPRESALLSGMTEWIQCGNEFLQADVVRWKEAIWEERGRKGRAVKIGEREVTAEVLSEDREWVRLLVRASTLLEDKTGNRRAHALSPATEINRMRTTLERSVPERLVWSDESVRAALAAERKAQHAEHPPPEEDPQPRASRKRSRRRVR
jgi:hypothetical protein